MGLVFINAVLRPAALLCATALAARMELGSHSFINTEAANSVNSLDGSPMTHSSGL